MKIKLLLALLVLGISSKTLLAQNTTKIIGDRNEALIDSLENTPYGYVLPFLGKEVRKKGYDIPLPTGIMLGFYTSEQDLVINALSVSRGDDELTDISDLVEFSKFSSVVSAFTIRPDVWIFPFMNVYAIINKFSSKTSVTLSEPFELVIPEVNVDGEGAGLGTTLTYGFGPVWFTGNLNWSWSKTPILTKPTQSFSSSLRIGTTKYFGSRKHAISFWVGANYLNFKGANGGSYDMTQLIPDDSSLAEDLLEKIDNVLDGANDKYEDFCAEPGNMPKCTVLDPIFEEFRDRIEDKIDGFEPPDEMRINYSFVSSPAQNWNMLVGAQYQFSKHWQARAEYGFLGSRKSLLFNVNYRFGILKRKG